MNVVIQCSVYMLLLQNSVGFASIFSPFSKDLLRIERGLAGFQNSVKSTINDSIVSSAINNVVRDVTANVGALFTQLNYTQVLSHYEADLSEDGKLDFEGLAAKYLTNSTVKGYDIVTDDGYILKLYNIKGNTSKPVLLCHGILLNSDAFIIKGKTSLMYNLVQNGYDVWSLNFRGNKYSRRHKTLNPDTDDLFWDYTIDQSGYYDLPAAIDFVLNATGQSQTSYIGFSQGCTTFFILTTTRPEYNSKIKIFSGLAPAVFFENSGFVWKFLAKSWPMVDGLLEIAGVQELFGYNSTVYKLIKVICTQGMVGYDICAMGITFPTFGYYPQNENADFFRTGWGHFPDGMSKKNMFHYFQLTNSGKFQKFDYGPVNNIEMYGSSDPPLYDLRKTTCPVALFVAGNDYVVGLNDANKLKNELPNVVTYFTVEDPMFTHNDFVFGKNASDILYGNVIQILDSYV